jgi:hypothetical protein
VLTQVHQLWVMSRYSSFRLSLTETRVACTFWWGLSTCELALASPPFWLFCPSFRIAATRHQFLPGRACHAENKNLAPPSPPSHYFVPFARSKTVFSSYQIQLKTLASNSRTRSPSRLETPLRRRFRPLALALRNLHASNSLTGS